MHNSNINSEKCFVSNMDEGWLWHKRLVHVNMHQLDKLLKKELVLGLPKLTFKNVMFVKRVNRLSLLLDRKSVV